MQSIYSWNSERRLRTKIVCLAASRAGSLMNRAVPCHDIPRFSKSSVDLNRSGFYFVVNRHHTHGTRRWLLDCPEQIHRAILFHCTTPAMSHIEIHFFFLRPTALSKHRLEFRGLILWCPSKLRSVLNITYIWTWNTRWGCFWLSEAQGHRHEKDRSTDLCAKSRQFSHTL